MFRLRNKKNNFLVFTLIWRRGKYRILGECVLISSSQGKASRTLAEMQGLPNHSTCFLLAKAGKPDIKRREPGIL